jgi:hypothetical protein
MYGVMLCVERLKMQVYFKRMHHVVLEYKYELTDRRTKCNFME